MSNKRRSFGPEFKLQCVLNILRGQKRPAQVCREHKMLRCLLSTYLLLSLLCASGAYAQSSAPVHAVDGEHISAESLNETRKNRVLSLDGDGDYVEMADSEILNDIGSQVTMEVWIKATAFPDLWIPIIHKSDEYTPNYGNRSYALHLNSSGFISLASASSGQGQTVLNTQNSLITLNRWYHVAGIVDAKNGVMRVYINGVEVARRHFGKDIYISKLPLRIGWWRLERRFPFKGQMDEVRIWDIARNQEQIQQTMHASLSGKEPGLVGYWQFDHAGDTVTDSSPSGAHGKLIGDAHLLEAKLPGPEELVIPTTISGVVRDELGKPVSSAAIRLQKDGETIAQAQSNASGSYLMVLIRPVTGVYDVSAGENELGSWRLGIPMAVGEQKVLDFTLKEAISIEGTLLMLDNATPHVAVAVQAVMVRRGEPPGRPAATVLSDELGKYRFINLKPGEYRVRCQVLDGHIYYRDTDDALTVTAYEDKVEDAEDILTVQSGKALEDVDFHFAPFKKGTWRNYAYLDGLADDSVNAVCSAPDGTLWFGTNGGVSRYDGEEFANFTKEKDGLRHNAVLACYADTDGTLWFGTKGGVSRYDGRGMGDSPHFTSFTSEDGLASNADGVSYVSSICRDSHDAIWFGTGSVDTSGGGVSRYDGNEFVTFTAEDGLAGNNVVSISRAPDGTMWFGTWGGGVCRYDGKKFVSLSGLPSNAVLAVYCTPDGVVWIGSLRGVSRYDGKELVNFTPNDEVTGNYVYAIHNDSDGAMWFGTGDGVFRYDGVGFVKFTTGDGLASSSVNAIHHTPDGVIWFGTGRGISRYDSRTMLSLTNKDGLVNDSINDMYRAPDGVMWLATAGGVSHYDGRKFVTLPVKADFGTICRDSDGAMWFTSWSGGNYRYDEAGLVKPTSVPQAGEGLLGVYSSSDGSLWFTWWGGAGRYDGERLEGFTKARGLAGNIVYDIQQDTDGNLWFGTRDGGVSRYDGRGVTMGDSPHFVNFTVEDGLADNQVNTVYCAPDGVVWFGTVGGVSRYDSRDMGDSPHFVNYTIEDGLVYNGVNAIHSTSHGAMWFGTNGGGACRYDGTTWTSLDARDGLSNYITSIQEDEDGTLWFGTADSGVISYRPDATPPQVRITSVKAGKQRYTHLSAIPAVTVGDDVAIEYSAIDFKTVPGKRQYRYRVRELDPDWRRPMKSPQFEWTPERSGTYTFEVQAIDRDLNYSEPASVEISVSPTPIYTRAGFIIGTILAAFLIPSGVLGTVVVRQRRQTFEPIQNPYIVGNPIRTKDMFFGRQSDFEFVRAKLAAGQSGLVIVFAGERRSGKTSILFQILNGALGDQFVPVLMDMQAMTVDSEAEFLEKMALGIDEALLAAGYRPSDTSTDFHAGNPTRAFERFMAQIMETLGDRSLLLLFDEYELIESKIGDDILRPDFITFFASLLEAHPRLSFIFTGSRHLQRRSAEYWNILIGKSLYRRISFLSAEDALRLIREPVQDRVIYPRGIPERIIRLTAGQPFYTQVMCQNMMDILNEAERNRVRQEDVDEVAAELADNPLPQMLYFWDGLDQDQKGTLSLLGEVLEDSNGYASAQTLLNFAQEQNLTLELELSDLERVLNDLFISEVLERERSGEGQYEYRFRVDLFRLWIRQAHSVWE